MRPHIYRPPPPLADWVACFWLWDGFPAPAPRERALPSGTLDLVINLERDRLDFFADERPESLVSLPGSAVCGAHARYFVIATSPHTSVIGVHFKPGGAYPFLGVPAGEFEGRHVAIEDVWGNAARDLRQRLLEDHRVAQRFQILESFLIAQARRPLQRTARARAALDAFEDSNLRSVADVNRRCQLSPKQLIALFREQVGLTPKAFWRVRRFQAALRAFEQGRLRGAELAVNLGYCDQSHLDREFRHFTGYSPRDYLAQQGRRPNHVPLHR